MILGTTIQRPETVEELLVGLDETEGPRFLLAGGTDLLVKAKDGLVPPGTWFDIWGLDELRGVTEEDGRLRLGALLTYTDIEKNERLQRYAPGLVDAAWVIGSPQIRNRGTLGGNAGNASPAGDSLPPLYTLGATAHLRSRDGTRELPVEELMTAPGETVIRENEIITAFSFPKNENPGAFVRLGQRKAQAITKVSVAVSCRLTGDVVEEIRLALGSVAPTVIRARKTEAILQGASLDDPNVREEAAETIRTEAKPISDIRSTATYRRKMAGTLLLRALDRMRMQPRRFEAY